MPKIKHKWDIEKIRQSAIKLKNYENNMPKTIDSIANEAMFEYDDNFYESHHPGEINDHIYLSIKSSLLYLLEEVKKELPERLHQMEDEGVDETNSGDVRSKGFEDGFNDYRQEVINLLNKLK